MRQAKGIKNERRSKNNTDVPLPQVTPDNKREHPCTTRFTPCSPNSSTEQALLGPFSRKGSAGRVSM